MKTSSGVGGVRRKKRAPERTEAYRSDKPIERAPAILEPVSDVKPSDLLGRLLLPRASAVVQQTRGQVYFSSLVSSSPSAEGRHDSHDSNTDASIHERSGVGNQECDGSARYADGGSGIMQGRQDRGKVTSFLAFQHST
jgi:hypothetical protein